MEYRMNILWDKLLVETHVIAAFFHNGLNRPVYYLFPNMRDAKRQLEKMKADGIVREDSVQIKEIRELFRF